MGLILRTDRVFIASAHTSDWWLSRKRSGSAGTRIELPEARALETTSTEKRP